MRPAARLQSAIELLDEIIVAARDGGASADQIASRFFAARRYAGSKDRRAVRDLVWNAIRRFGERPLNARTVFVAMAEGDREIAELFDGSDHGPHPIEATEQKAVEGALPNWLLPHLSPTVDESERGALLDRAPLDIRVNLARIDREAVLEQLPEGQALPESPAAIRLPTGTAIDGHPLLRDGFAEIQDLGSQLICDGCAVKPGMKVLDLCAGAGGKTLALAANMQGQGSIIASDANRARLNQLLPRAARAHAAGIETRLLNPGQESAMLADLAGKCDVVLIDAPCSGSGTWRRNPETRWRLDPARLKQVVELQARLLDISAEMVAPGGHLVYAVCSLIGSEGRGQMAAFLERHAGWQVDLPTVGAGRTEGPGILLTPAHDRTDGFFFARLRKL